MIPINSFPNLWSSEYFSSMSFWIIYNIDIIFQSSSQIICYNCYYKIVNQYFIWLIPYSWLASPVHYCGNPEGCGNKGGKGPFFVPSGIPFNSLRLHTSNLWVSSQLEGSVQIWAKVPDVSIPYGITFNVDTKNPFIFWVSVVESLFSKDKDSDHDGHNSDSSDDESEKKNSRRIPKKPHW